MGRVGLVSPAQAVWTERRPPLSQGFVSGGCRRFSFSTTVVFRCSFPPPPPQLSVLESQQLSDTSVLFKVYLGGVGGGGRPGAGLVLRVGQGQQLFLDFFPSPSHSVLRPVVLFLFFLKMQE